MCLLPHLDRFHPWLGGQADKNSPPAVDPSYHPWCTLGKGETSQWPPSHRNPPWEVTLPQSRWMKPAVPWCQDTSCNRAWWMWLEHRRQSRRRLIGTLCPGPSPSWELYESSDTLVSVWEALFWEKVLWCSASRQVCFSETFWWACLSRTDRLEVGGVAHPSPPPG